MIWDVKHLQLYLPDAHGLHEEAQHGFFPLADRTML
jgi:hypothetical protein